MEFLDALNEIKNTHEKEAKKTSQDLLLCEAKLALKDAEINYYKNLCKEHNLPIELSTATKVGHIKELKDTYPLTMLFKVTGIPKNTYHYHLKQSQKERADNEDYELIKNEFMKSHGRYGARRLKIAIEKETGVVMSKNKINRLMRKNNLRPIRRKKTYKSYKAQYSKLAPNLVKRDFKALEPMKKLTTDVTEFSFPWGKVYFQCYLDMFNSEIICYEISKTPSLDATLALLNNLIAKRNGNLKGIVIHSDQGWQYKHVSYISTLKTSHAKQSMSSKGNCYENAIMENFFGVMKNDIFYGREMKFLNYESFKKEVENYIYEYNNVRIKTKLKDSPVGYRKKWEDSHK